MSGEQAVKMPGQKKFHRLQPDALLGTVRCGAGFHSTSAREYRWRDVDAVLPSQQCRACWTKASR